MGLFTAFITRNTSLIVSEKDVKIATDRWAKSHGITNKDGLCIQLSNTLRLVAEYVIRQETNMKPTVELVTASCSVALDMLRYRCYYSKETGKFTRGFTFIDLPENLIEFLNTESALRGAEIVPISQDDTVSAMGLAEDLRKKYLNK